MQQMYRDALPKRWRIQHQRQKAVVDENEFQRSKRDHELQFDVYMQDPSPLIRHFLSRSSASPPSTSCCIELLHGKGKGVDDARSREPKLSFPEELEDAEG